ncbi:MAG: sugar ABC transporter permease YjfF [Clostridiales bacterium]|nr:sugar ABC transporter permease YjfF [Clostridiales bacterium]
MPEKKKKRTLSDANLLLLITIVVFFVMYIGAVVLLGGGFRKAQMFFNILDANAGLVITSCGMSLVMITQGIDISIGGVVRLICMCCAVNLELQNGNPFTAFLIAMGIGLAFGVVQGFLVAYLEIQPFIVSLAGMYFAKGLTTIIHTNPISVTNEAFKALRKIEFILPGLGYYNKKGTYINTTIELGSVIALIVVILMFLMLRYTKFGRNFYAVGGNKQSALMLGINVKFTKFMSHVICSLLAGLGGFVYFMHIGSAATSNANGMEMNAIASSIIGGTLLTGGVGNVIGTLFGVLSLNTIQNIVSSIGLDDAWWTGITIAGMLCLFLIIQSVVMSRTKKK